MKPVCFFFNKQWDAVVMFSLSNSLSSYRSVVPILELYDENETSIHEDLVRRGYAREDMNAERSTCSRGGSPISSSSDARSGGILYYPG